MAELLFIGEVVTKGHRLVNSDADDTTTQKSAESFPQMDKQEPDDADVPEWFKNEIRLKKFHCPNIAAYCFFNANHCAILFIIILAHLSFGKPSPPELIAGILTDST